MRRDIRLRRGTSLSLPVVARKEDGTLIDLTGASISWRIGADDRKTTTLTKTVGSGVTVTGATSGAYTVALTPADTAELPPEFYSHAAEVTESDGTVTTALRGWLCLERDLP